MPRVSAARTRVCAPSTPSRLWRAGGAAEDTARQESHRPVLRRHPAGSELRRDACVRTADRRGQRRRRGDVFSGRGRLRATARARVRGKECELLSWGRSWPRYQTPAAGRDVMWQEPYVALSRLAKETGGLFVDNTNDVGSVLRRRKAIVAATISSDTRPRMRAWTIPIDGCPSGLGSRVRRSVHGQDISRQVEPGPWARPRSRLCSCSISGPRPWSFRWTSVRRSRRWRCRSVDQGGKPRPDFTAKLKAGSGPTC